MNEACDSAEAAASNMSSDAGVVRQRPAWKNLSADIIVECLSYCNALDLVSLRCSCSSFRQAARAVVSRAQSLDLSVFSSASSGVGRNRKNYIQKRRVACLLQDAGVSLHKLNLSGLGYIRGTLAGPFMTCRNLTSLNLSGYTALCPRLFREAFAESPTNLLHLDLTGCYRLDTDVIVYAVAKWPMLETVKLGGRLGTNGAHYCMMAAAIVLKQLRVLDLSDLNFDGDTGGGRALFYLPSSLESLSISRCSDFQAPVFEKLTLLLLGPLYQLLEAGSLPALISHMQSGNMGQVWVEVCAEMQDDSHLSFIDDIRAHAIEMSRNHCSLQDGAV